MPRPENVVFFATPAELRAWFEANHDTAKELWLGYHKNRSAGFDQAREAEFRRHRTAWKFFESQAPWYRRTATYWVMSAKREETRDRRLKVLIDQSKNGERIGLLSRPSPRSRRLVS